MHRWAIAVFASLVCAATLSAATMRELSDADLLDRSRAVVVATVLDSSSREVEGKKIVTDTHLRVEEVLKGEVHGERITVTEWGGLANGHGILIPGSAAYEKNTRVVAFLRQRADGTYYTAAMERGVFRFAGDQLVRTEDEVQTARNAREFIENLRTSRVSGTPLKTVAASEWQPATNAAPSTFVITGLGVPLRWDCPAACTKEWTVGNPPAAAVNAAEGVTDAMAAWTNEPLAWISLDVSGFNEYTAPTNNDVNDIIFDSNATQDNTNIGGFCDGSVGCAWIYFNGEPDSHDFQGEHFYDIVSSDVVIRPGSFSQGQFEGILAHEFGHAIGLKHGPSGSLMAPTLSSGTTATLKSYDKEAVATVYGNGLPCVAPTVTGTSGGGTVTFGNTTKLSVSLSGTTPFTYEWYEGATGDTSGGVISTSDKFTTPAITEAHAYWVRVTNACGTDDSPTITVSPTQCTVPTITTEPQSTQVNPGATATLSANALSGTQPLTYQWYQGAVGDTTVSVGTNSKSFTTPPLTQSTQYWLRVSNACGHDDSVQVTVTVIGSCTAPSINAQPVNVSTIVGGSATFSVNAAGDAPLSYQWYQGAKGDTTTPLAGETNASLTRGPFLTAGSFQFWVRITNACGSIDSETVTATIGCGTFETPEVYAPPMIPATYAYDIEWTGDLTRTPSFEMQEATNASFTENVHAFTVTGNLKQAIAAHSEITTDTRFYYRVRAIFGCTGLPGEWSTVGSTVVTKPQPADSTTFAFSLPEGTSQPLVQDFLVPGFGEHATNGDTFSIVSDQPWLTVFPPTGALSAGGTTVQLTVTPGSLDVGTTTATLVVTRTQGAGKKATSNATSIGTTPFSVSLVTPVTPAPRTTLPPPGTLLIPAIAHADGINSRFQSDVRIVNASNEAITYDLNFTPSGTDGTTTGKRTTITIAANDAIGLDDIVKAWYGSGVLGELGFGTLEIRPMQTASGGVPSLLSTFASSRTYNVTPTGTLGQFIPAIPLSSFIGNIAADALSRISLQQVAQSSAYRSNLGFVEGSGSNAQLFVSLLDGNNSVLRTATVNLGPYQHMQTGFSNLFPGVTANDARLDVQVVSPTGKATAYASVLDNQTSDPLLVFPAQAGRVSSTRYVVPGVAELENGAASNFHTDMRIYNASANPVVVTLSYYPQTGDATPRPASINLTLNANEVRAIDNVLPSLWSLARTGGAVTIDTANDAPLVVTARTYSRNGDGGTYGQFIPGVTSLDAVGAGERALQVLQLEQSAQYRTNLGLVEVTGNPVRIEITGTSGGKITARTEATLNGNEFRQIGRVFEQMAFPTVYNGRITVRVIEGAGRVAAYGSVVDNRTVDPTYVPSQ